MARLGLLGDTHANHAWIMGALAHFHRADIDTVIQVGDLGVWPGGEASRMFDRVDMHLESWGMTVLVAPGNHEDYDQIDALSARADGWLEYRSNILLAPRGLRTKVDGVTMLWLGGAGSVDRTLRTRQQAGQKVWWPQEAITMEQAKQAATGGRVDVMVCHDAPTGVEQIERRIAGNPLGFNPLDIEYAKVTRARLTEVVDAVTPQLLLHGHYHFPVDDRRVNRDGSTTRVFGLDQDGSLASMALLDTDDLTIHQLKDLHTTRR